MKHAMSSVYMNSPVSDDQRRECLFRGDLFAYGANPANISLCGLAREIAEEAFAPHHPTEAEHCMPVEQYVSILAELKPGSHTIQKPRSAFRRC